MEEGPSRNEIEGSDDIVEYWGDYEAYRQYPGDYELREPSRDRLSSGRHEGEPPDNSSISTGGFSCMPEYDNK